MFQKDNLDIRLDLLPNPNPGIGYRGNTALIKAVKYLMVGDILNPVQHSHRISAFPLWVPILLWLVFEPHMPTKIK